MTDFHITRQGRRIAYVRHPGAGIPVMFLGGLRSDMTGTKALHLEQWAQAQGRAFLRFDYSGHGQSDGRFEDGCIGDWHEDARAMLDLIGGRAILVGSSMGGWQSLLLARDRADAVAGLVTIAAAPDFTEDSMWAAMDDATRARLRDEGRIAIPSAYGDPYVISRRLIEEGRQRLVLRDPLPLPFPTRFLQGTDDRDVDQSVALRLLAHATGPDMRLTLVKGADHRFSTPECLDLIIRAVEDVSRVAQ